jgi:Holliday junction resolvase RusA-like endonuclease
MLVDYENERLKQMKEHEHDHESKGKLAMKIKYVNLNDPKEVKAEIDKIFKNMQNYKKKINAMKNDNHAVQIEVDKYRK